MSSDNDDWQQKAWAAYAALPSAKHEIQAILDKLTEDIRKATGQDAIEVYLDVTPLLSTQSDEDITDPRTTPLS